MDYKLIAWVLGALILLVLIIFYFAYSKYARQKIARHAVNGLERLLKRTRLILIILVLALAGDLGYGHFSPQNSAIHMNLFARTSKVFSSVKNKVFDKSAESSSMDLKKKESSEKASSKKASSEKKEQSEKNAVKIVKGYYEKQGTQTNVEKYEFIKTKISRYSKDKVYEVGAYETENGKLVQVHDYEVNTKGKFNLLY